MCSILDVVCINVEITTKSYGEENTWSYGSCVNNKAYESDQRYTEQCCQEKGDYNVVCKDSYGDGWHGGYVEIADVRYCDDFADGFEEVHEISMKGEEFHRSFYFIL